MKKVKHVASWVFAFLQIVLVIYVIWVFVNAFMHKSDYGEIGERAVHLLYEYGTPEQLDAQMAELKSMCSEGVFIQLTIDNEKRTLNTYLKFKQDPTSVNILESTSSYVVYSINNKNIDASRKFIFRYKVDNNKLVEVKEAELIEFADYFN